MIYFKRSFLYFSCGLIVCIILIISDIIKIIIALFNRNNKFKGLNWKERCIYLIFTIIIKIFVAIVLLLLISLITS